MIFTLDELRYLETIKDDPWAHFLDKLTRNKRLETHWIPVHTRNQPYTCPICKDQIWVHAHGDITYYRHGGAENNIDVYKMTVTYNLVPQEDRQKLESWLSQNHMKVG